MFWKGGTFDIRDKFSFNYSPITNEEEWQELINKYCTDSEEFILLVKNFDEAKLTTAFVDKQYGDYLRNINGTTV